MKRTRVLTLSIIAVAINLAACQKTPEEKIADALVEMKNSKGIEHDKEVQRMNEIGRQGDAAFEKLLGPKKSNSAESKKATGKTPDSETK